MNACTIQYKVVVILLIKFLIMIVNIQDYLKCYVLDIQMNVDVLL